MSYHDNVCLGCGAFPRYMPLCSRCNGTGRARRIRRINYLYLSAGLFALVAAMLIASAVMR